MAVTNYSPLLGLALPTTGDLQGTWGTTVNDSITSLLDSAIAGTTTLVADTDVTLTTTLGASNTAREAIILWAATNSVTRYITAPAQSKAYIVINAGTAPIVIRGVGPTTGITLPAGSRALVAWTGVDYAKIVSNPVSLTTDVSGVLPVTNGGTGQTSYANGQLLIGKTDGTLAKANLTAGTNVTITNGDGTITIDAAGGSSVSLSANNTWTGTQTFNGTSSIFGATLLDANETVNVVAAAPSATTNYYVQSGSVQYYTTNAANNWTLNIAFSSGTSMNTALAVGQSVTFTLITTQGATAYYNNAVTIDGSAVTPKWIGGAPTAGNASGLDVYRFAVVKTASATYTVLASLTQYK